MTTKRKSTPERKRWQPLGPAVASNPERWVDSGASVPHEIWANDLYSVYVRYIGPHDRPRSEQAIHISFHRHNRAAIRDWRHVQAIKNEVAGPERIGIEVYPPESMLMDEANEYHIWVLPPEALEEGFPFLLPRRVGTQEDMEAEQGKTRARQRDWQPGLPTGLGLMA
jgi:hypothetical protein